ncbi:MAG TPA: ATP-binding protein [Chthoniobacterales bacterium]
MNVFARKGLVTLGFAALFMIWAADFLVEQRTFHGLQQAQRRVGQLKDARMELLTLVEAYVNAETGQRGYLLTGNESYLAPYLTARSRLQNAASHIRGVLTEQSELGTILDRGQAKLDEMQRTIDLRRTGGLGAALELVQTGAGKNLMDQIREAAARLDARLEDNANRVLDAVNRQRQEAEITSWVFRGVVGLALIGVYLAIRWIWRQRELVLEAEQEAKIATQQALASERAAHSEAARANQLKDEFLGIVSHELRTPLSAILTWTSLLRTGPADNHELQEGLQTIERNARAQAHLVDDLLDVSRIISGKVRLQVKPVDLRQVAAAVIDGLRPSAQARSIQLVSEWHDAPAMLMGDAHRLQQIGWNLVSNAIKFTPRRGRVCVRIAQTESAVELSVEDTGKGIRREFLGRVFERFSQQDGSTTRQNTGLGLGLAIARHLVELHGGTISAESRGEGQGTTFRVQIPVAAVAELAPNRSEPASNAASPVPAERLGSSLHGLRVLAVEDQADARAAYIRILGRAGAEVRTADSVAGALAILAGWKPEVIVSDIGMPGEDGYSFVKTLRSRPPDQGGLIPALALTAFAKQEDKRRALAAGFNGHMAKPVDMHELTRRVAELASGPSSKHE